MSWGDGLATEVLIALVASAVRASAVAAMAALALAAARRATAETRLRVWTAVLVVALAMPMLDALVPIWRLPVLSEPPRTLFDRVSPARLTTLPVVAETIVAPVSNYLPTAIASPVRKVRSRLPTPAAMVVSFYGIVALLIFARAVRGWRDSVRLRRQSQPLEDSRLPVRLGSAARVIGIGRYPRLLTHPRLPVPCAVGVVRPAVVLSSDWREWNQATLDAVLRHELAHIARADALVQRLALFHLAIFWFSPLSWWLVRRVVALGEEASDDVVLAGGTDPASYAELLLRFASGQRVSIVGRLSMANGAEVERRLERILQYRERRPTLRRRTLAATAVAIAVMLPIGLAAASIHPIAADATRVLSPSVLVAPARAALSGTSPVDALRQAVGASVSRATDTPMPNSQATAVSPVSSGLTVLVFDLPTLPGNDLARAIGVARETVRLETAQANSGSAPKRFFRVVTIDRNVTMAQDFTNDPQRLNDAFDRVGAANQALSSADPGPGTELDRLRDRVNTLTGIASVCSSLSAFQAQNSAAAQDLYYYLVFNERNPASVSAAAVMYLSNGVDRGLLARFDIDRIADACTGSASRPVLFRWAGGPRWESSQAAPAAVTKAPDFRGASLVAMLFDLSQESREGRIARIESAKLAVETLITRGSVGLNPYPLIGVGVVGNTPTTLEFTGDHDRIFAALDKLAADSAVPSPVERQRSFQAECRQIPRSYSEAERFLMADANYRRMLQIGTARDWDVVPYVSYAGPDLETGTGSTAWLAGLPAACQAPNGLPAASGLLEWSSFVAAPNPPARPPLSWSLNLAARLADSPVTVSFSSPTLDLGYVSLHVRNDSTKTIRSITLGAVVTTKVSAAPQRFTRSGPSSRIPPGASIDIASAIIDPASFASLGAQNASAVIGVVSVEFEDGTTWTSDFGRGK